MELMKNDDVEFKQKIKDKSSGIYSKMTTYAFPSLYLDYFENYTAETTATIRGRRKPDIHKIVAAGLAREFASSEIPPKFQVGDASDPDWVNFSDVDGRPIWEIRLFSKDQVDYFLENFSRLTLLS